MNNVCTFCSNLNHPGWLSGNRCRAAWGTRERICPCTSTDACIDLGCGCGEPGPSGCDNKCGSTLEDKGCGCGKTCEVEPIETVRFVKSEPGQSCNDACEEMGGCVEDML